MIRYRRPVASDAANGLTSGLAELASAVQAVHERCAREHDVSPTLARLLGALSDRTPTMNELAGLLALDKSSTSGLVDRAERRGLVRRVASQLDRRAVRVRLTEQGADLNGVLSACVHAGLAAIVEPLAGEDREVLAESLRAILSPR